MGKDTIPASSLLEVGDHVLYALNARGDGVKPGLHGAARLGVIRLVHPDKFGEGVPAFDVVVDTSPGDFAKYRANEALVKTTVVLGTTPGTIRMGSSVDGEVEPAALGPVEPIAEIPVVPPPPAPEAKKPARGRRK